MSGEEKLRRAELEAERAEIRKKLGKDTGDFSDLRATAVAKERKRQQTAESGEKFRSGLVDRIASGAAEAAVDVPISMLQSTLLESADEAAGFVGAVGEKISGSNEPFSKIYRTKKADANRFFDEARERSPGLTSTFDFLAPNPVGNLKRAGQIVSKVSKLTGRGLNTLGDIQQTSKYAKHIIDPLAQGFLVGYGASENGDLYTSGQAAVLGLAGYGASKGLGFAIGGSSGSPGTIEASFLGFRGKPNKSQLLSGETFIDAVNTDLHSINKKGHLVKGSVFDPKKNMSVMPDGSPAKQTILKDKVNQAEAARQLDGVLDKANNEVERIITGASKNDIDAPDDVVFRDPELDTMVRADIENYDDNAINLIREEIALEYKNDPEMMDHLDSVIESELAKAGAGHNSTFVLSDIHHAKKRLQRELREVYGKQADPTTKTMAEETVKKKMANFFKDVINDVTANGPILGRPEHKGDLMANVKEVDAKNKRIEQFQKASGEDATSKVLEGKKGKRLAKRGKGKKAREVARRQGEAAQQAEETKRLLEESNRSEADYLKEIAGRRAAASESPVARLNQTAHEIYRFRQHLDMDIQGKEYDEFGNAVRGSLNIRSIGLLATLGEMISDPSKLTRAQMLRSYDALPQYAKMPNKKAPDGEDKITWLNTLFLNRNHLENILKIGGARISAGRTDKKRRKREKLNQRLKLKRLDAPLEKR